MSTESEGRGPVREYRQSSDDLVAMGLWAAVVAVLVIEPDHPALHRWAVPLAVAAATATIRRCIIARSDALYDAFELGWHSGGAVVPIPPRDPAARERATDGPRSL